MQQRGQVLVIGAFILLVLAIALSLLVATFQILAQWEKLRPPTISFHTFPDSTVKFQLGSCWSKNLNAVNPFPLTPISQAPIWETGCSMSNTYIAYDRYDAYYGGDFWWPPCPPGIPCPPFLPPYTMAFRIHVVTLRQEILFQGIPLSRTNQHVLEEVLW